MNEIPTITDYLQNAKSLTILQTLWSKDMNKDL